MRIISILRSSIKMSAAKRRGRWQGGAAAGSTQVRQGVPNAASGILIELLSFLLFCISLPAPALANDANCYAIQNQDQKNFCLAKAKNEKSYCYSIQESDNKNACLSKFNGDTSYCYSVRNEDQKNYCLATAKHEKSYCYSVRENDTKNLCLAELTNERSYCYSIGANDRKNQCLARFR
jgi:hypothetical protein